MSEGKARDCAACGRALPSPLTVCVRCGGAPIYAVDGADWAVEAGPVSAMRFRSEAVEVIATTVDGVDRAAAEKLLGSQRVRVVEGITRPAATALAERLGKKETNAAAVQGPTPKLGLGAAFRNGLPFLGIAGGTVLGLLVEPIGTTIGLTAGGGAAVALGAYNAARHMPVLGRPAELAVLPYQVSQVADKVAALQGKLPPASATQLADVVETGFLIIGRLTDPDDVLSTGSDGVEDGMGKNAVGFVQKAVTAAQTIVRDGAANSAASIASLEQSAQMAAAANQELQELLEVVRT